MIEPKHTPDQGKGRLSTVGRQFFNLIEFDENEELLLEVRKHPFGLLIIVFTSAIISFTVLASSFILASTSIMSDIGLAGQERFVALFGFIFAVLIFLVTGVYAQLYRSNVVYITNEKVAQVLYITIFNRKISQLNIGDIQDVTVSQRGFFAQALKYGTLVIESAGEQQNYTFSFVPNPQEAAKTIITAHEANLKRFGN